jgi:hypothetical protein
MQSIYIHDTELYSLPLSKIYSLLLNGPKCQQAMISRCAHLHIGVFNYIHTCIIPHCAFMGFHVVISACSVYSWPWCAVHDLHLSLGEWTELQMLATFGYASLISRHLEMQGMRGLPGVWSGLSVCVFVTLYRSFHCGPKYDLYGRPMYKGNVMQVWLVLHVCGCVDV